MLPLLLVGRRCRHPHHPQPLHRHRQWLLRGLGGLRLQRLRPWRLARLDEGSCLLRSAPWPSSPNPPSLIHSLLLAPQPLPSLPSFTAPLPSLAMHRPRGRPRHARLPRHVLHHDHPRRSAQRRRQRRLLPALHGADRLRLHRGRHHTRPRAHLRLPAHAQEDLWRARREDPHRHAPPQVGRPRELVHLRRPLRHHRQRLLCERARWGGSNGRPARRASTGRPPTRRPPSPSAAPPRCPAC